MICITVIKRHGPLLLGFYASLATKVDSIKEVRVSITLGSAIHSRGKREIIVKRATRKSGAFLFIQ